LDDKIAPFVLLGGSAGVRRGAIPVADARDRSRRRRADDPAIDVNHAIDCDVTRAALTPITCSPYVVDDAGGDRVKRKVEVTLLGQTFTLRSEKDEAHLHQVASFVNRRLEELRHQARKKNTQELALLLALNIADELFESEDRASRSRGELRAKGERLLQYLDGALAEAPSAAAEETKERKTIAAPEASA
jgi:cell division protein ZapA (FtsZ GTPase activity inhibitor)